MKKYKPYFFIIGGILCIYFIFGIFVRLNAFYYPICPKQDLTQLIGKHDFTEDDYALFFKQTGLSKPIIDELHTKDNFKERILTFQTNYFKQNKITDVAVNFFTHMEQVRDDKGYLKQAFTLAPYKNGDILITKCSYTCNYRHGHVGIVIDAANGRVLESLEPNTVSIEQDIAKWTFYPTFKLLRLRNTSDAERAAIARYASEHLRDLPYSILTRKGQVAEPISTHCSFLVWQAFKAFNIDLDSDGGFIVSPKDIAKSPYLETLQIYGFDPLKDW